MESFDHRLHTLSPNRSRSDNGDASSGPFKSLDRDDMDRARALKVSGDDLGGNYVRRRDAVDKDYHSAVYVDVTCYVVVGYRALPTQWV